MPPKPTDITPSVPGPEGEPALFEVSVPTSTHEAVERNQIERNPHTAMGNFLQAMKHLSAANSQGGFQIIARGIGSTESYERAVAWAKGDPGDLQNIADRKELSPVSEAKNARSEYRQGVQRLAGRLVSEDDLTLRVAFIKFFSEYGVPNKNLKQRRAAQTALKKAIQEGASELPVKIFYDPETTVYTSSLLDMRARPAWEDVAHSIGIGSSKAEAASLSPELATLFDDSPDMNGARVLTKAETKMLAPARKRLEDTHFYAQRSKAKKMLHQAQEQDPEKTKLTIEELAVAAGRGTSEVHELLDVRSRKASERVKELTSQADVVDEFRSCSSESPYRDFEITSETVTTILTKVVPDITTIVARNYELDADEASAFSTELVKGLFSEDRTRANQVAGRVLWIIEDRKQLLEQAVRQMTDLKKGFGSAALSRTIKP